MKKLPTSFRKIKKIHRKKFGYSVGIKLHAKDGTRLRKSEKRVAGNIMRKDMIRKMSIFEWAYLQEQAANKAVKRSLDGGFTYTNIQ